MEFNPIVIGIVINFAICVYVLVKLGWKLWERTPDVQDLDQDLDELYITVQELQKEVGLLKLELLEYVDTTLKPLQRRIKVNSKEDLNIKPTSRRGIIGYKKQDGAIK